ncbi:MAG: GEVED domain-containing protein [Chitinophagales bacterium]
MKKNYTFFFLSVLFLCGIQNGFSQVAYYVFASSGSSFSSVAGGAGTIVVATTADDENFGTFPIGFTFTFNGNEYSTFGLNANGFISMGYVPVTTNNALSSGLNNNIIAGFNNDLYGIAAGAQISYQTSGAPGSRVLTAEWGNWGFFSGGGGNEFNFQIRLLEGSNKIQVVYGNCPGNTSKTLQVGIRGQTNLDFSNRTTLVNWSATTSGTSSSANCTYSATVKPPSGLTFEWTPAALPKTCGTISSAQQTGTASPGSAANPILRIDIPVNGSTGSLTLNSITVVSRNTTDNDIASGGVKIYTGTSAAPTAQIGSGVSFSAGSAVISSLNTILITGTNYLWITYDLKITAVVSNVLDAKVNIGGISISASGGALAPGSQPVSILNPAGSKTVNYCTPVSTYGGCSGDQITGFTFAGINYNNAGCISSPGYVDVGTTGTTTQGQTNSFTLTLADPSDYGAIWIDFNDNASFEDVNELVYSGGPGTSQTGSISIPVTANAGTHRVRVRDSYSVAVPSSCGGVSYGETKDFRLTINTAVNCSGAPAASATVSSSNPVCSAGAFTLSLSVTYVDLGITFQWQSSSNGNTYTNIAGATSYSYLASQSAAAYYRCKITCTQSGQSIFSSALLVNQNQFTSCYCIPAGSDCFEDKITSVAFGGINNASSCSANGYGDYSLQTAAITQGASHSVSVGVSNGGTEYVSVWIDYNHNAVFDASERTFIGSGFNQTISSTIQISPTALTGITRMRVRLEFAFEPTDPCSFFDYGETEDYSVNISACNSFTFYADADGDGYGNPLNILSACSLPSGYVTNNTDCNDANSAVRPGAAEVCNGIDDDCDNLIDEGLAQNIFFADADHDTYGNISSTISTCQSSAPAGYVTNSTDCNDANSAVHPGAAEVCNGIDDDCDNLTDEGLAQNIFFADADNDTYGNISSTISTCQSSAPAGYVTNSTDCNDASASINPGAPDICNGIDDNCNGMTDENAFSATVTPAGSVAFCKGTPFTLTANGGTGITYQWLKNSASISGATGMTYSPAQTASYSVRETNSFSCTATSPVTSVTVNPLPSATITTQGSLDICAAGSVVLQANSGAGLTYQWKKGTNNLSGATGQSYTATTTGTYKVVVTNSNGCSKTSAGKNVTKSCKENFVSESISTALLVLYPNPSDGAFVLELQLQNMPSSGNAVLIIANTLGQIILEEKIPVNNGLISKEVQINDAASGIYLVKVMADNLVFSRQIIISK